MRPSSRLFEKMLSAVDRLPTPTHTARFAPAPAASAHAHKCARPVAGFTPALSQRASVAKRTDFHSASLTATRPLLSSRTVKCTGSPMATQKEPKNSPAEDLLRGKKALVTGGSRGIGRAVAEEFAKQGAHVIIVAEDHQNQDLEETAENCRSLGAAGVEILHADFDDVTQADTLANKVLESCGAVDVLVNNAGAYGPMSFDKGENKGQGPLDGDPADWDRVFRINTLAPMHLTRWLAPKMVEQGDGWIFNICSIEALSPYPSAPAYSSAKWALRGWSKACWATLKPQGVKVVTVNPAQTDTPMTAERPDSEMIKDLEISPKDIAEAIMLQFRLSGNVVIEEITVHTGKVPKHTK